VTTGLFLTPGAARTAYEAGAVHALVKEGGIRFGVVGTCSAGAINGSFVATGQVDELLEQWSTWRDKDILRIDVAGLLRGAVLWSPSFMTNHPQRRGIIDRFIGGATLQAGVRFRTNLANLTTGRSDVFEWPGAPIPLAEGVDAAVAVPTLVPPKVIDGMQYADGLTIDGQGRVYVAASNGVQVFSPQGQHLGTIPTPRPPQNLAFAGRDKKTLYIVGRGVVSKVEMLAEGFKDRPK